MIGLSVAHVFSVCYIQYGVELDVPAATILSMFGLRAQVISPFLSSFLQMLRLIIVSLVVLVAEYFITGYFLRSFHIWKLYHIALFCEGEAVKFEGGMGVRIFLELIH